MKTLLSILSLALGLAAPAVADEPVYRCIKNGKTIFTDGPVDASCQPMQLNVVQPDPAEVARLEEEKRVNAERDRLAQEQAAKDRLIKAQTDAAIAQSRVDNSERRSLDNQQMRNALDGGYGYGYDAWPNYYGYPTGLPVYGPIYRPGWNTTPPVALPRPTPPGYRYGVDQIGPR